MNCQGCEEKNALFVLKTVAGGMEEYYCAECMANIIRETPEEIHEIYNIKF